MIGGKVKRFLRGDEKETFLRPEDVCKSSTLSHSQKIELLEQWEEDLRLTMVASEEGMTIDKPEENMSGAKPGQAAEQLRAVRNALMQLGAGEKENAAVNKTGG